ncbi:MAG: hypothetical protein EOP56_04630 [Sphingobacteriales bacterium]|nr:MAG: hypothetical protein EOP56_04630 [Sphingobacteriales bacterium]
MKYNLSLTAAALLLLSTIACKEDTKPKAIAFSTTIAQTNDTLLARNYAVAEAAGYSSATKDFSRVNRSYGDMVSYIDKKTAELEKMEDVGGKELKAKELEFLKYEKEMIAPLSAFSTFTNATSKEECMAAANKMFEAANYMSPKLLEINRLLKEYTEKNQVPLVMSAVE